MKFKKTVKDWSDHEVLNLCPSPEITSLDTTILHPYIHRFGIRFRRPDADSEWSRGVYSVEYRKGGQNRRMSIGIKVGELPYLEAKRRAEDIRRNASDPAKDPALERQEAKAIHSEVFKAYIPAFIHHMQMEMRSEDHVARTEGYLTKYFPNLMNTPIKLIRREHVANALRKILERDPNKPVRIAMTRARAALSAYMTWLVIEGKIDSNPVGNTRRYSSDERDRYLSPAELAIVWNSVTSDTEFGRILRLLILTGARRTQIGDLRKQEIDRENNQIVLPKKMSRKEWQKLTTAGVKIKQRAGGSKHGGEFRVPLSRQVLALIDLQPDREGSEFVFGEKDNPDVHYNNFQREMEQLHERIGDKITEPWTLHDLRRTFATLITKHCFIAPGVKVPPHIADAAINHKPKIKIASDVAGIYNHNDYLEDRIPVMQVWADFVESLVKPSLKVVA